MAKTPTDKVIPTAVKVVSTVVKVASTVVKVASTVVKVASTVVKVASTADKVASTVVKVVMSAGKVVVSVDVVVEAVEPTDVWTKTNKQSKKGANKAAGNKKILHRIPSTNSVRSTFKVCAITTIVSIEALRHPFSRREIKTFESPAFSASCS